MQNKLYLQCLPFLIIGIYMMITGAVSKSLISESDMPATEEDKSHFEPTPTRRALVILGGLGCIIYSMFCMWH